MHFLPCHMPFQNPTGSKIYSTSLTYFNEKCKRYKARNHSTKMLKKGTSFWKTVSENSFEFNFDFNLFCNGFIAFT